MKDSARQRIYSTLADDPELEEAIEAFVLGLAERVDALQDAQLEQDLSTLSKLAHDLCLDATRLGYPDLAQAAEVLALACTEEEPKRALDAIMDITELGRRVRQGHRGAL